MQYEQRTVGVMSQFQKTIELFFNWKVFEYPEQTYYHFQNTNQNHKIDHHYQMQHYLNTYTKNMLDKKIAYYASMDYKVHKTLQEQK